MSDNVSRYLKDVRTYVDTNIAAESNERQSARKSNLLNEPDARQKEWNTSCFRTATNCQRARHTDVRHLKMDKMKSKEMKSVTASIWREHIMRTYIQMGEIEEAKIHQAKLWDLCWNYLVQKLRSSNNWRSSGTGIFLIVLVCFSFAHFPRSICFFRTIYNRNFPITHKKAVNTWECLANMQKKNQLKWLSGGITSPPNIWSSKRFFFLFNNTECVDKACYSNFLCHFYLLEKNVLKKKEKRNPNFDF